MPIVKVIVLAIVQGLAELLPVSSSAHVVVAEKLMGLDPTSPEMTLLLVMLHTGTMFAVIVYFWKRWAATYFQSAAAFTSIALRLIVATVLTAVIGYPIIKVIEKTMFKGAAKAEIEQLFGRLDLVAAALLAVGILILVAGLAERRRLASTSARGEGSSTDTSHLQASHPETPRSNQPEYLSVRQAAVIGAVQGLCLPFRGFSRSGATISVGMLDGVARDTAETFSFALAVVLTPAVIGREALRLLHASHQAAAAGTAVDLHGSIVVSLLGALFSFAAGLAALKWLSSWLEAGRWYLFGIYCIFAAAVVFFLHTQGY